jgi:hypothetical protein
MTDLTGGCIDYFCPPFRPYVSMSRGGGQVGGVWVVRVKDSSLLTSGLSGLRPDNFSIISTWPGEAGREISDNATKTLITGENQVSTLAPLLLCCVYVCDHPAEPNTRTAGG